MVGEAKNIYQMSVSKELHSIWTHQSFFLFLPCSFKESQYKLDVSYRPLPVVIGENEEPSARGNGWLAKVIESQ